jgi:hypothetical protein
MLKNKLNFYENIFKNFTKIINFDDEDDFYLKIFLFLLQLIYCCLLL